MTKFKSSSEEEKDVITSSAQNNLDCGALKKRKLKMIWKFSRELICLLALVLTTIASLPRYSKIKNVPAPIFPTHMGIDDWSNGALSPVQSKISGSELSLVYFYASWDAESNQTAKNAFQEVAKSYSHKVYFAAVNCWRPTGECRGMYPKVSRWPIVVAYLPNVALQYKGDWNYHALGRFVERLFVPIERITTSQELFHHKMSNDYVVLGLFDKLDTHYQMFFKAAIKTLELNRNIAFTVFVGNSSSNDLGNLNITRKWPAIKVYNRFSSSEFTQPIWKLDNIIQWISNETRKQALWYHFSQEKSFTLGNHLKSGQNIVLFTPRTILRENNIEYLAFKQAFYAYKNCNNNPSINLIIKNIPFIQNDNINFMNNLRKTCEESQNRFERRWLDSDNPDDTDSCSVKPRITMTKIVDSNSTFSGSSYECSQKPIFKDKVDEKSPDQLLKYSHERQCKYFFESQKSMNTWKHQETEILNFNKQNFCFSNMTLSFHIIDSLENFDFIKKILPSINSTTEPKVFIIDSDNEGSFVMSKEHSFANYIEFINDFYSRSLPRLRRTTFVRKEHPIPFISFEELTTESFEEVTNREDENSIVMFFSPECALCNIMARSLLQVQGFLKDMSNMKFYRIDSDNNDVNWEYSMETYPTILFLPKNKTAEARIFSTNMKIDSQNIFGFILANLSSQDRILALVLKCRSLKTKLSFINCMKHLRATTSDEVDFQLKKFSSANKKYRIETFEKILILKKVHNSLSSESCDFNVIIKDMYKLI